MKPNVMQEVRTKILCPKCGTDVTEQGYHLLHEITGYSIHDLKNGGMRQVVATWEIGQMVIRDTGIKVANERSANEIVKVALEEFRKIQEPEIKKEKVKERAEREILKLEEEIRKKNSDYKELEGRREEEIKQLNEQLKEMHNKYNANLEGINEHLGRLINIPTFKGVIQEKFIAQTLKKFVNEDEFTREKVTKEGEDIKATIIEGNKEIATVVIESKNTKNFSKDFLTQIRKYMDKHKTPYGILACQTLPDDAQDNRLYKMTDEGILITSLEYLPFGYLAMRELAKKTRELQIDANTNKKEYAELLRRFKETVESKDYCSKIASIKENVQLLRNSSDKFRSYSKSHCEGLDKIAKSVIGDIANIEHMNKEALGGDINAS